MSMGVWVCFLLICYHESTSPILSSYRSHLQMDFVRSPPSRQALLSPGDPWDLLDIDAQGMERPFLQGIVGWLRHRVRRLHVSTHDREIHWEILQWLKETVTLVGLAGGNGKSLTRGPIGPYSDPIALHGLENGQSGAQGIIIFHQGI